ncbi:DUF3634 family protein [Cerasicoccus frondis]|uniref:DUF3634 family protein n=1 Tax=Cerasicoccus frondis TaxID=490090 RepID=UPI002852AC95|nr:DUF3634 family protein [Cerasicoccus frondis]
MKFSSRIRSWLPGTAFVIEVGDGALQSLSQRKLPPSFLATVKEKLADQPKRGAIFGVWQGTNLTLEFSPEIPRNERQPLLNAWHADKDKFSW